MIPTPEIKPLLQYTGKTVNPAIYYTAIVIVGNKSVKLALREILIVL